MGLRRENFDGYQHKRPARLLLLGLRCAVLLTYDGPDIDETAQ